MVMYVDIGVVMILFLFNFIDLIFKVIGGLFFLLSGYSFYN